MFFTLKQLSSFCEQIFGWPVKLLEQNGNIRKFKIGDVASIVVILKNDELVETIKQGSFAGKEGDCKTLLAKVYYYYYTQRKRGKINK